MRSGATDYLVSDGLTVNGLDRAVAEATGPNGAAAGAARTRIADLRHEIIALRRTALRTMRLLKSHAVPLLGFAWKMTAGGPLEEADQPGLAHRLARLTRSLTGLIDDTAILAATRHGKERPTPVDLNHLVQDLVAGDVAELRSASAHVRCTGLPTLLARRSHMAMLFEELLVNAVRAARLGVAPEIELGAGVDGQGNPVIWMTENGLPLSSRKQALGAQMTNLVEPDENAGLDPHVWSLCQRLAEKNRGEFRITEDGDQGCKVMIRFVRDMLV
jgi:signal transduction histidine kinase